MTLLEPVTLAGLELRNKIAVAPMSRMQANDDGTASPDMALYYARYARNGAGLVFAEAAYVDECSSRAYFNQPGLASEPQRDAWVPVTRAVHAEGGRIFAQLQHGGRLSEPGLNVVHIGASDSVAAGNTWQTGVPNAPARAATPQEIDAIVEAFGAAARRAVEANFDGVEIHGARGYLLDEFLSTSSNGRSDEYGGDLKSRLKMPLAVVRRVRQSIGRAPLSFNFSLYKMDDGRYSPPGGRDEVVSIVRALRDAGADIVHVTTRKAVRPEAWDEPLARTVRDASMSGDVIANGGLSTPQDCEAVLENCGATMVSMARALLANPDWITRAYSNHPLARYVPGQERLPLLTETNQRDTTER